MAAPKEVLSRLSTKFSRKPSRESVVSSSDHIQKQAITTAEKRKQDTLTGLRMLGTAAAIWALTTVGRGLPLQNLNPENPDNGSPSALQGETNTGSAVHSPEYALQTETNYLVKDYNVQGSHVTAIVESLNYASNTNHWRVVAGDVSGGTLNMTQISPGDLPFYPEKLITSPTNTKIIEVVGEASNDPNGWNTGYLDITEDGGNTWTVKTDTTAQRMYEGKISPDNSESYIVGRFNGQQNEMVAVNLSNEQVSYIPVQNYPGYGIKELTPLQQMNQPSQSQGRGQFASLGYYRFDYQPSQVSVTAFNTNYEGEILQESQDSQGREDWLVSNSTNNAIANIDKFTNDAFVINFPPDLALYSEPSAQQNMTVQGLTEDTQDGLWIATNTQDSNFVDYSEVEHRSAANPTDLTKAFLLNRNGLPQAANATDSTGEGDLQTAIINNQTILFAGASRAQVNATSPEEAALFFENPYASSPAWTRATISIDTATPTSTATPEPTPTATATVRPTDTATSTAVPEPTATSTPKRNPTATPTATATVRPTDTRIPTNTPPPATATIQIQRTPGAYKVYLPFVTKP